MLVPDTEFGRGQRVGDTVTVRVLEVKGNRCASASRRRRKSESTAKSVSGDPKENEEAAVREPEASNRLKRVAEPARKD